MVASVWHFIKCPTVLPYPASPVSLTGCCVCWRLCVCVMFRISGISDLPQAEIFFFYSVSVFVLFFNISSSWCYLLETVLAPTLQSWKCSWDVRRGGLSECRCLWCSLWPPHGHSPRKMIRCWNYVSNWAVNLPEGTVSHFGTFFSAVLCAAYTEWWIILLSLNALIIKHFYTLLLTFSKNYKCNVLSKFLV